MSKHAPLLDVLKRTVSHPEPQVALPVLAFWSAAGAAVLRTYAAATQPPAGGARHGGAVE